MSTTDSTPLLMHQHATNVTCLGVKATLYVDEDGGITYTPNLKPRHFPRGCSPCCGCQPQHLTQQICGWHVIGAALESPNSFRVWYCTPPSKPQLRAAPKFKLRKTPPYVCSSGSEAAAVVQRVRMAAAWHGRDQPPRVVAIINPHSGQGKSQSLFHKEVLPMLEAAAGMSISSLITQHPGHATELLVGLNLAAVDLLLCVGGDGTVFEVLQGLLSRPDWDRARLVPIAHVPGGSGNGLAHSTGLHDAATAAFAIAKGVVSPMDVASVLQPPATRLYMMLMACYGSLSNLDVGTEHLRWLGDTRFTLGALWEIVKAETYNAGVAWWPAEEQDSSTTEGACTPAGNSSSKPGLPGGRSCSNGSPSGPPELPISVSCGGAAHAARASNGATDADVEQYASIQDFPAGPNLPLLQQLGRLPLTVPQESAAADVLPPGWHVSHAPLHSWSLMNPPYIAAAYKANPLGSLHTGAMNMMSIHGLSGLAGRLQALDVQVKAQEGLHMDIPCLTHTKVAAVMFEPKDNATCLMVDGEVVPNAPVYVEVHKGLIRVVINPAHQEEPAAAHSRGEASRHGTS